MDSANSHDNSPYERSEEELSWDAEFANMDEPRENGYTAVLSDVARLVIQIPRVLVQLPMAILPEDTAKHARAAAREGFLALRSLLGAIGDGIENMLAEPDGKPAVAGPPGTWGTARHSAASSASSPTGTPSTGKARRIELSDEVSERGGGDGQPTITIDDLTDQEGRGLRADLD